MAFQFELPQGVKVLSVSTGDGEPVESTFSDDNRRIIMAPIRFLRSGESVQRILDLEHSISGTLMLGARLVSAQDPQGATVEARIMVRPNL